MATFDQQELYPEPVDKAAAILESIVINHPFIDGNKRMGYVLARLLLLKSGLDMNFGIKIRLNLGLLKTFYRRIRS